MGQLLRCCVAALGGILVVSCATAPPDSPPPPGGPPRIAHGIARFPEGPPAAGADVKLYFYSPGREGQVNALVAETTTGPDGSFAVASDLTPALAEEADLRADGAIEFVLTVWVRASAGGSGDRFGEARFWSRWDPPGRWLRVQGQPDPLDVRLTSVVVP